MLASNSASEQFDGSKKASDFSPDDPGPNIRRISVFAVIQVV